MTLRNNWAFSSAALAILATLGSTAEAAELERGPYLQGVGTDRITVVFDLDEPAAAEVRVRLDEADVTAVTTEAATHHEVELSGLTANTEYSYAVRVPGGLERYHFRPFWTAPEGDSPFTMMVFGDTRSDDEQHARGVAAMARENARLVLHLGDLVADGEEVDQWDVFFDIERPLISRIPIYPLIGNHDEDWDAAANYRGAFALPGDELHYSFDYGSAHFVMLDGHVGTEPVCIEGEELLLNCFVEEQLQWLEDDLSAACEREETRWIFVSIHEGPYSSDPGRHGSPQMRKLLPLFEQHGVTAIFSGHDHYYERGVSDNGIPYVISAGGGAGLYELGRPCAFPHTVVTNTMQYHYLTLDVDRDAVHLTAKTPDGTVLDETSFTSPKQCSAPEPPPSAPPESADDGCSVGAARGASGWLPLLGLGLVAVGMRRRRLTRA